MSFIRDTGTWTKDEEIDDFLERSQFEELNSQVRIQFDEISGEKLFSRLPVLMRRCLEDGSQEVLLFTVSRNLFCTSSGEFDLDKIQTILNKILRRDQGKSPVGRINAFLQEQYDEHTEASGAIPTFRYAPLFTFSALDQVSNFYDALNALHVLAEELDSPNGATFFSMNREKAVIIISHLKLYTSIEPCRNYSIKQSLGLTPMIPDFKLRSHVWSGDGGEEDYLGQDMFDFFGNPIVEQYFQNQSILNPKRIMELEGRRCGGTASEAVKALFSVNMGDPSEHTGYDTAFDYSRPFMTPGLQRRGFQPWWSSAEDESLRQWPRFGRLRAFAAFDDSFRLWHDPVASEDETVEYDFTVRQRVLNNPRWNYHNPDFKVKVVMKCIEEIGLSMIT